MVLGNNASGHIFDTTFTADGVLYADASGVITSTSAGSSTEVLTSNGPGVAPTFQAAGGGGGVIVNGTSPTIDFKTIATTTIFTPTAGLRFVTLSAVVVYDTATGVNADWSGTIGNNAASYDNWSNFVQTSGTTTAVYLPLIQNNVSLPVFTNALPPVFSLVSPDTGTTATGRVILTGYYVS